MVEDDGSESASNASEGSDVSSVAFSKELPRLEALEGFEAEKVKGHHGGPPQNPHEQMTSESSNESDSLSFEKMEHHQAFRYVLPRRCSKRCTVAQLYQRWSFHAAGFLACPVFRRQVWWMKEMKGIW